MYKINYIYFTMYKFTYKIFFVNLKLLKLELITTKKEN